MVGKPTNDELEQNVKESGIIQESIMHAGFFLVVIVCVFIWPSAYAGKAVVQTDDKYKILILNSYHKEFEWTDGQVYAAREILTTNLTNPELYVEYMDTKRINNEEYLGLLYKTLRLKYRNVKLDAIIATDDNALNFLLEHRNELFGEVPVAFAGINGYSPTLLADRTLFTGVIEVLDIIPTIDLAIKLHPDTKKIVVVNDNTPTGKWIRKDIEAAIPHYKGMQFEFLSGEEYTTEGLLEKLRALPKDNIVLTTVWLRDKTKKYISMHDGISLISSNSTVPVYGLFRNHLGNGIIGGKLLDGNIHGKIAAEMVVRILGGERPNDIPVLVESANLFMFDYTQLDRWGISVSDLPVGSTVINMPFSFYEAYKYRIWSVIAIVLVLLVVITLLITNTLRMHRAKENLRRYETIISTVSDPMSYIDNNYIYITINDAYTRVFNKSREEILGRSIAEMLGQDVFDDQIKGYFDKCLGGEEVHYQNWFELPDGKRRYMDMSYYPYFKNGGKVSGLVVNARDMTESKKVEEALRESEEKYRSMMESMKDPVYICSQDYRVEYINPAMIQRTGRDVTGEHCFKAIHDLDEKCPWCMQDKIQQGEHYETEIVSPKDNRSYHVSSSPIVHVDGSISKMTVLRDTTDLKKLETQLQQASKMEALGTLAGGIAHDFNNLLMAIQGRTSIMLMNKDSSHPDFGRLRGIEDNIESAADLTKQLLGFARGGKYEIRPTDLNELIKKQNRMFGRTKKEITIRGKYEENLWSVEVDRGQIEQALLNLYVNAWQAMPGGGDLNLETENVTFDETEVKPFSIEPGRYVKISVTDTGVGMDKATRERIFEPFFTTKEMGRGTGLGLASVYGIIKNHGGFINVYSEKGHGTTFNIYLPASEKEVTEEKKPAGDTLRGSETVLFVDDEDMIIEIAEELLEQLGYKVLIARSGKEAIEIYEENKERIDIVLLDMIMPDMSGSDTYDRMKKIDPDIKVLLFSGYSINGRATEILDRGCNGFIQKPFKMKQLSQKLREILDEK